MKQRSAAKKHAPRYQSIEAFEITLSGHPWQSYVTRSRWGDLLRVHDKESPNS